MDEDSYQKLFIVNKDLVIDTIKQLRELEASCDLIACTDPEHYNFTVPKMLKALLNFKSAKFDLIAKAFYGDNPNPYDLQFD